jgi:hypothetical protein
MKLERQMMQFEHLRSGNKGRFIHVVSIEGARNRGRYAEPCLLRQLAKEFLVNLEHVIC